MSNNMSELTADTLAPLELLKPIEAFRSLEINDTLGENLQSSGNSVVNASASKPVNNVAKQQDHVAPTQASNEETSEQRQEPSSPTTTKATTTPTEQAEKLEEKNTRGCYLTFETTSEGTLFINWSETPIENALAFFSPTKPVPKFKFKQNGGKSELIRNLRGGTGKGMKRYFDGWAQFVKLAREFQAELTVWHSKDVALYYLTNASVSRIALHTPISWKVIDAVAALTPDNSIFEGVATITRDYFAGCGNREGAALLL